MREKAEAGQLLCGTIDTWLAYKLSGGELHVTDISNASRTLLFNIHRREWDEELLSLFSIPKQMLPEVRSNSEVFGTIVSPGALKGVPLAGMVGDQQAALMGQICTTPGLAKNTYGTGCFLLMNTGKEAQASSHKLLSTIAWEREDCVNYALEGSVFVGGAIVQWLRDGLGIIENSSEVEQLAGSVENSGGVMLVPALTGLGAPYWDAHARGMIIGLTRGSTAAHIARAALEGVAFQVADLFHAMQSDAETTITELRVDGGAAANDLLLQFQADILQIPLVRPSNLETTALGAAYMAGLAVGYWESPEEIATHWQIDRRFEPEINENTATSLRDRWHEAVSRCQNWAA